MANWSWRWVFWLNIPFGLISMFLVGALLVEERSRRHHAVDVAGAVLLSCSTLCLLLAILPEELRPARLPSVVWVGVALIGGVVFVRNERRHPEPLLPLGLFADRVNLAANVTGVLLGLVLFGGIGFIPLYVQNVLGGTPVRAGATLIPLSAGWTLASVVGGRVVHRVGFTTLVRVGCVAIATGAFLGVAGLYLELPTLSLVGLSVCGIGMGSCISSFTVSVQERVIATQKGIATALTQFSRAIGGALGVAALGSLLSTSSSEGGESLAGALRLVFAVTAGAALVAASVGLLLYPSRRYLKADADSLASDNS